MDPMAYLGPDTSSVVSVSPFDVVVKAHWLRAC